MDPERWKQIQELFHEAVQLPEQRRREFVRDATASSPEIEADVLALLEEDEAGDSVLDQGVGRLAGQVFDRLPAIPERIDAYRVLRLLGEGGMGVVYLAEHDELDGRVAIKVLRDSRLSSHRRARFLLERRILSRLSHPSISRIHDAGTLDDGTPYFVMEYCDGLPLTTFCAEHGLTLRARLRLFRKVCEAVQHAHRQALIHRDLKPSNILALRSETGEPMIKLLDFGIAKQLDPDEDAPDLTRTAFGIMTPAYAAPEQLEGRRLGVSADVYSLGVVLYELLTGGLPFDFSRMTPLETARTVSSEEAEKPSRRGFAVPVGRGTWTDLDVLCLTAMHRDPERRYQTVEALLRDTAHLLDGEPLEARPENAGYRLRKFVRRNVIAVTSAAAVLAAVVTLVSIYTVRLSAAHHTALAEAQRAQRIQAFMLDLFEGGDELADPEKDLKVTTLIERGVREARALDVEPVVQAELYQTLGGVYQRMSDFGRARELFESALEQRQELLGADDPSVAESRMALGLLAADEGRLEEAERSTREALAALQARLPADHPRVAAGMAALGEVLVQRGKQGDAIEILDQAAKLQEAIGDEQGLITTLEALAAAHSYSGDYETADAVNRRLLPRIEERLGKSHPAYASALISLAATQRWLGYPEEAEKLYREALEINEHYHGRDHPTVASNLGLIGAVLADQERYDEAREVLRESLQVRERVFGPMHYEVALCLNQLARIDLALGDVNAAEAGFARELEIYRATVGDEHPSTATGLSNMASIYYRQGDYARAEESMRRSLAIFEAAFKPDHMDVGIAHIKLGRLLAGMKRHQEALAELSQGYEIVVAQANPTMVWVKLAREELAAVYEALGQPERAAEFRAPLEPDDGD